MKPKATIAKKRKKETKPYELTKKKKKKRQPYKKLPLVSYYELRSRYGFFNQNFMDVRRSVA